MTDLPAPLTPGRYRIAVVCLGNICRSPIADVVLSARVEDAGLGGRVEIRSAGTGGWHAGEAMDDRAAAVLTAADYDPTAHRAQQVDPAWFADTDLMLAMDEQNLADLRELAPSDHRSDHSSGRLRLFRDFDPTGTGDVPDPWYGGPAGFESVLATVERTAAALVADLERVL